MISCKRARGIICLLLLTAAAAMIVVTARAGKQDTTAYPLSSRISNADEIVITIRKGLQEHAKSITVSFDYGSDIFDELNGVIDAWVEAALAETDDPAGGDYIRYQIGGYHYSSSYTIREERRCYTVKITPEYYCTARQECEAGETAGHLLDGFRFGRKTTEYEKIRVIYDYLCGNVTYDKVHHKNPYTHLKSTAYAALVMRTATCQGYCTALYRMLRASGIDCRIVTGTAMGEETDDLHAWVIAGIGGLWYNLDPTWDAGLEEYRYFLKGESDFEGHVRNEKFLSDEFLAQYPMAQEAYHPE